MTDRIKTLTVHLEKDYRDDDVAELIEAIKHLRQVAYVDTNVVDYVDHDARMRIKHEMGDSFRNFWKEFFK